MRVIVNRLIPFKGFKCVNLFGILFVRKGCVMRDVDFNHEAIHTAQMKEMFYIFFYLAYFLEWIYRWIKVGNSNIAYYGISFEQEAYKHQSELEYLERRKRFSQFKI